jgi:hypothetical protein
MAPVTYDPVLLRRAFGAYVCTTPTCSGTARMQHATITGATTRHGDSHTVPAEVLAAAVQVMARLPQGGRHVHQAAKDYRFWLARAIQREAPDAR